MALTGNDVLNALGMKFDHVADICAGSQEEQAFSLLCEDVRLELDRIAKLRKSDDIRGIPLTQENITHILASGREYFERGGLLDDNGPVGSAQKAALLRFSQILGGLHGKA